MTEPSHRVHGLAGDQMVPDWPTLARGEVAAVLHALGIADAPVQVAWHSPRPLSAAALVEAGARSLFVKRHHASVRSVAALAEEHAFMAHLAARGVPVSRVLADAAGTSAFAHGPWVYEVHLPAPGHDLYRDTMSWVPPAQPAHAHAAGAMLARLHRAAADYTAAQRSTHLLVARSELCAADDPVAVLTNQLPFRPGLADYLQRREWQRDLAGLVASHGRIGAALAAQPRCWTHGDWHVSNLCWSGDDDAARVSCVLDFGLAAATFALFDLATAIERNAIAWLALEQHAPAARPTIARALIAGYASERPLTAADRVLLAQLLPRVHMDFALSEVEYFHAVTGDAHAADVAYDTFLLAHAAWFGTPEGRALLDVVAEAA